MVRYSSVRRRKCEPYVQYFENTVGIVVSLRTRQGRLLRRPCSLIPKYFSVLRHRPTRSVSKSFLLPDKSRRDFPGGLPRGIGRRQATPAVEPAATGAWCFVL